jgi:transcriptional regulator with XRE-family HTH domain
MGVAAEEITPFLKARRAALDPSDLGLPGGYARRRVRGLRREEVAQQAGISVDYYTRIEQGRATAVSDSVVDAVARALRLTPPEHAYLRNITLPHQHRECTDGALAAIVRPTVRPEIRALLDAMDDTVPAVVYGPGTDILAWNRLAGRLAFEYDALDEADLNAVRLTFLHPDAKSLYPDWDDVTSYMVAGLRAESGGSVGRARTQLLICEMQAASQAFREQWDSHAVEDRNHGVKVINNPVVGPMELQYELFALPADPGQRLSTYTAPKGSEAAIRLRALADLVAAG